MFSFIHHTKIALAWVLEFVDQTLRENHENWYPTKIKSFTVCTIDNPKFEKNIPDIDLYPTELQVNKANLQIKKLLSWI